MAGSSRFSPLCSASRAFSTRLLPAPRIMTPFDGRRRSKSGHNKDKMRFICDHLDDIFDMRGYYRKHVAAEDDSVYRSVSDVLFGTQMYKEMLEHAVKVFAEDQKRRAIANGDEEEDEKRNEGRERHRVIYLMAEVLGITFELLETSDPTITTLRIAPGGGRACVPIRTPLLACADIVAPGVQLEEGNNVGSAAGSGQILICYSGLNQYDPVFSKKTIEGSGMVQSILYEMLYHDVFKIPDAYRAAQYMLHGYEERSEKPDIYDRDFEGTAMEALEENLIPFPYKVAKAMDPEIYRNIEYDVWSCESRNRSCCASRENSPRRSPTGSSSRRSAFTVRTIGNLTRNTPCVIRDPTFQNEEVFGFVIGPTHDRRQMEVHVPTFGYSVFVPRKGVLPIKNPPKYLAESAFEYPSPGSSYSGQDCNWMCYNGQCYDNRCPYEQAGYCCPPEVTDSYLQQEAIQNYNLYLVNSRDPELIQRCNFSVPPPPMPPLINGEAPFYPPIDIYQSGYICPPPFYPPPPPPFGYYVPEYATQPADDYVIPQSPIDQFMDTLCPPRSPSYTGQLPEPAVIYSLDNNGNYSANGPQQQEHLQPPPLMLYGQPPLPYNYLPLVLPGGDFASALPSPTTPYPFPFYPPHTPTALTPMFNGMQNPFQFPMSPTAFLSNPGDEGDYVEHSEMTVIPDGQVIYHVPSQPA